MDHSLLIDTFEGVRGYHTFNLLGQAEGHQLGDTKLDTRAKGYAEVDT